MFRSNHYSWLAIAVGAVALGACSNTGGLTTSSIEQQKIAKKPAIDPACVSLVSKIDSLRKDGITDRVAKAGTGKSKTVAVYRKSLARMAELDRTNAEYQRRCGTLKPGTATARAPTPAVAPAPVPATAKKAAADAVKAKATAAAKKAAVKTVAKAETTAAVKKSSAVAAKAQ